MSEQPDQVPLPPVPAKKRGRAFGRPSHSDFDWYDRHVGQAFSMQEIAESAGVTYEDVDEAVRYVGRFLRKQYKDPKRYDVLRTKQLYRLERVIVGLMRQFDEGSDVNAAKELRMAIHEWMEITGGLEPKKVETSSSSTILSINSSIERMLTQGGESVPPKILQAAERAKIIENKMIEKESA